MGCAVETPVERHSRGQTSLATFEGWLWYVQLTLLLATGQGTNPVRWGHGGGN